MGDRRQDGQEDQGWPDGLPGGYWWSVAADGASASLYRRYGWVATVTATCARIRPEPPLYGELCMPCRGLAHGQRLVARALSVRLCLGPPARRQFRERLRRERARRLGPLPPSRPEDDEAWTLP